jgi:carbamoyltransferase
MRILGISAFYHDSAAALIEDGRILAAAQEERFTRTKHDPAFPANAIRFCTGGTAPDYAVFYDKPFLKFERLLETYLAHAPQGFSSFRLALPLWINQKLFQKSLLVRELSALFPQTNWQDRLLFTEHHLSHAASAFYPSPFAEAAVLTIDGVGEWATTSIAHGHGKTLQIQREIHFPHSLGLLYSAFTYYTGFRVNSGEYKLMGLAPYGQPKYTQLILDHLIDLRPDGSFRLNMAYFNYPTGLTMTNARFHALFGGAPPRQPDQPLTQQHMDIAASIQAVLEEAMLRITRSLAAESGSSNLCLAGGVALNSVANGKILRDGKFKKLWIQPASGDAGGALGAALAAYHLHLQKDRTPISPDAMNGAYLGPEFTQSEIESRLSAAGAVFHTLSPQSLRDACVQILSSNGALGCFEGRMEFGPRALGARSILGDARSPSMQSLLNLKVKYRESFRPFAPAVLREDVSTYFDLETDSPYMLLVAPVADTQRIPMTPAQQALFGIEKLNIPRSTIPAVTHVDYSARIQTVHAESNPFFHALLSAFKQATGCPVLVNTSFNVRGEPIVCTPEDAYRCFMGTQIEALAIGNCLLYKHEQPAHLQKNYSADLLPD